MPIVAANYSNILTMKGGSKSWSFKSGRIPIKVLKPIETEGLKSESVDELARTCREQMLTALKEMEQHESTTTNVGSNAIKASGVESGTKKSVMPI